jgi:hypothetical protein
MSPKERQLHKSGSFTALSLTQYYNLVETLWRRRLLSTMRKRHRRRMDTDSFLTRLHVLGNWLEQTEDRRSLLPLRWAGRISSGECLRAMSWRWSGGPLQRWHAGLGWMLLQVKPGRRPPALFLGQASQPTRPSRSTRKRSAASSAVETACSLTFVPSGTAFVPNGTAHAL